MMYAYYLKRFELKTDIPMKYPAKERELFYNEQEFLEDLKWLLEQVYEEYMEITNCILSYDEFYNKFPVIMETSIISLNHKFINSEKDEEAFYKGVKSLSGDELYHFLMSHVTECSLYYDHNLNLKNTYTFVESKSNYRFNTYTFAYKSLFPDKYHDNKYKDGDRVKYNGNEYFIHKDIIDNESSIYHECGYSLMNEIGEFITDDKFDYYPVDEDLELVENSKLFIMNNDKFKKLQMYISEIEPKDLNKSFSYNKIIRSDNHISIDLFLDNDKTHTVVDNYSYTLLINDKIIYYVIISTRPANIEYNKIVVKYDNIIIDQKVLPYRFNTNCENVPLILHKYLG